MLEFLVMLANCPVAERKRKDKLISSDCLLKGFC